MDPETQQPARPIVAPGPVAGMEPVPVKGIAALLCAVALMWLATRPYFGVAFDARFYMVEALNVLDPSRFADDLYFKFGS